MSITITGASGRVARLTIDGLLQKGVSASELTLVSRSPERLAAYGALGARLMTADLITDPSALPEAFAGADRAFIMPLSHPPDWVDEAAVKTHAVQAAAEASVRQIVYLSSIHVGVTPMHDDDLAVEEAMKASGMDWTVIRTATFAESIGRESKRYIQEGRILTNAGQGRIGVATRQDLAAAIVAALTGGEEVRNRVFNIVSDAVTYDQLAAVLTEIAGRPVEVHHMNDDAYAATAGGRSAWYGRNIREGKAVPPSDLKALVGRDGGSLFELLRANAHELRTGQPPDGQEMQFAFLWQARGEPRPYV